MVWKGGVGCLVVVQREPLGRCTACPGSLQRAATNTYSSRPATHSARLPLSCSFACLIVTMSYHICIYPIFLENKQQSQPLKCSNRGLSLIVTSLLQQHDESSADIFTTCGQSHTQLMSTKLFLELVIGLILLPLDALHICWKDFTWHVLKAQVQCIQLRGKQPQIF